MMTARWMLAALEPRQEGWAWWLALVGLLVVVFLLVAAVRRQLVRPMTHKPTDETDSWAESARRLPAPDAQDADASDANEEAP